MSGSRSATTAGGRSATSRRRRCSIGRRRPVSDASRGCSSRTGTWRMWYVSGTGWRRDPDRPAASLSHQVRRVGDGTSLGPPRRRVHRLRLAGRVRLRAAVRRARRRSLPDVVLVSRGRAIASATPSRPTGSSGRAWTTRASSAVSDTAGTPRWSTYPLVVDHGDRLHMLYNGNGYGRTGIGLAWSGRA